MTTDKILVVALDNLGDAVMASAVIAPLKKYFPGAFIGLWVKEYTAALFDGHPLIGRVHAADPFWDASPGRPAGRGGDVLSALNSIRAEKYDTALLLNTEWRRALAVRVAGVGRRIGYDRRHSGWLLTEKIKFPSASKKENILRHFIDDHMALIEEGLRVPAPAEPGVSQLFISRSEQADFDQWCANQRLSPRRYWVAHLFSGDPLKNWPLANWLELIALMRARRPDQICVALWGPAEQKKIPDGEFREFQGKTCVVSAPSLGLLKALLAHASTVVDGDSGPGHVAAALGAPVVSLFGPTNPLRSRPIGAGPARIVSARATADIAVVDVAAAMGDFKPRV